MGGKAPSKRAADVSLVIEQALAPHTVHTLTVDRGHEFALGPALQESLGAPLYFCQARCPWQRGTNENTNGLLREYFPKRTPLDGISPTRIQQVHDQLNQRFRKRLRWKTPEEAHTHRTLHFLRKTKSVITLAKRGRAVKAEVSLRKLGSVVSVSL